MMYGARDAFFMCVGESFVLFCAAAGHAIGAWGAVVSRYAVKGEAVSSLHRCKHRVRLQDATERVPYGFTCMARLSQAG